jgi:hypothetical protein
MNSYDGLQRFQNELAENTRKTKEALCTISTQLATISNNVVDLNTETGIYNTNELFVVSDTGTITLPANTYHSVSYVVIFGTANITVGSTLLTSAPQGYSADDTATGFLTNSITITGLSTGTKVAIKTIK